MNGRLVFLIECPRSGRRHEVHLGVVNCSMPSQEGLYRLESIPGRSEPGFNGSPNKWDRRMSMSQEVQGQHASTPKNGRTRLSHVLGVPLAEQCVRQWPQMQELVRGRELIGTVEGNFEVATLEVGRRLKLNDVVVVEWTINYGDGRLYRNVTIGELVNGEAMRVTDYWGEPTETPEWRKGMTERLEMPPDGTWPSVDRLRHY